MRASETGGGGELVSVCPAITRKGHRCTQVVDAGQTFCHRNDQDRAEERQLIAARGGRAGHNPLVRELHRQLEQLGEDVASGALVPYRGAVMVQAINARIRLAEFEVRMREQEDLIQRLDELERSRGGGGGW